MKILSPLILVGLILLAVFTLANWSQLSTPTELAFLIFTLKAPLGLVLLGSTLVFVGLFTGYILILRTAMLLDARRYSKELRDLHQLAERSEASRLSDLRGQLDQEFAQLRDTAEQSRSDLNARIDELEQALQKAIDESARSLAAHLGEVEDKFDRNLGRPIAER